MSSPLSGYSSVFVARIDHADQDARDKSRTEEMIWAPSPSLGMNAATFFGVLYGGYVRRRVGRNYRAALNLTRNPPPPHDPPLNSNSARSAAWTWTATTRPSWTTRR